MSDLRTSESRPMTDTEAKKGAAHDPCPLLGQLTGDLTAGAFSAILISPAVTILDRAVVERTSTGRPLIRGLRSQLSSALRHPRAFFLGKPLGIVWTLYAATYVTANAATTLAERYDGAAAVSTATFASTFLVNVPLGVWKDLRFAEIFGSAAASGATAVSTTPRVLPRAATATFLVRDAVTIFGSFTLPTWVSAGIPDSVTASPHAKATITQLTVPVMSQLVASPIHLIALDYYERQGKMPFSNRVAKTKEHVPSTIVMRCIRIIPAFSIGCVANLEFRSFFHNWIGSVVQ